MNELTDIAGIAQAAIAHLKEQPSELLIVLVLIAAGVGMKAAAMFPNRFIPASVIVAGCALNVLIGDIAAVSHTQRHPEVVLGLQGTLLGFAAWALHASVLKRFERFLPFLGGAADEPKPKTETKDNEPNPNHPSTPGQ